MQGCEVVVFKPPAQGAFIYVSYIDSTYPPKTLLQNFICTPRPVIETRVGEVARVKLRGSAADARGHHGRVFKFAKNLK